METAQSKPAVKGCVKSVFVDRVLAQKIRSIALKLEREESYVMRLLLRRALGLKETGKL